MHTCCRDHSNPPTHLVSKQTLEVVGIEALGEPVALLGRHEWPHDAPRQDGAHKHRPVDDVRTDHSWGGLNIFGVWRGKRTRVLGVRWSWVPAVLILFTVWFVVSSQFHNYSERTALPAAQAVCCLLACALAAHKHKQHTPRTCADIVHLPVKVPGVFQRRQAKGWPHAKAAGIVGAREEPLERRKGKRDDARPGEDLDLSDGSCLAILLVVYLLLLFLVIYYCNV